MQSCSSVDLRSLATLCFPYPCPRVYIHKAANWQRWIYLAFLLNVTTSLTKVNLHGSSLTNLFGTALSNYRYPLFWFIDKIWARTKTSIDIGLFTILWNKTKKQRNIWHLLTKSLCEDKLQTFAHCLTGAKAFAFSFPFHLSHPSPGQLSTLNGSVKVRIKPVTFFAQILAAEM